MRTTAFLCMHGSGVKSVKVNFNKAGDDWEGNRTKIKTQR
jgi:hypothetical protein